MSRLPIYIVDAFASGPFTGNPAAVCLLKDRLADERMAQIAMEMNLSETAFLLREGEEWRLRWLTPETEVDLCGHATLAAAHTLWENGLIEPGREVRFCTRSGLLTASKQGEWIVMDFPAEPPEPVRAPEELVLALGLIPRYIGRNRMDYVVEADNEETVRSLRPDFGLMMGLPARGIIVTSRAARGVEEGGGYDFVSRAFFPGIGVDEDPVTGSAHCALAPYWGKRLRKEELTGWQASRRGGLVRMRLAGQRVLLLGQAVTVVRGELDPGLV